MAASSDARPDSSMTLHLQMKLHTMDEAINAFIRLLYGEFGSLEIPGAFIFFPSSDESSVSSSSGSGGSQDIDTEEEEETLEQQQQPLLSEAKYKVTIIRQSPVYGQITRRGDCRSTSPS